MKLVRYSAVCDFYINHHSFIGCIVSVGKIGEFADLIFFYRREIPEMTEIYSEYRQIVRCGSVAYVEY